MHLFVGPMDSVLMEFAADGRVRFEGADWTRPTLPERRAIIYAARQAVAELEELVAAVDAPPASAEAPAGRPEADGHEHGRRG